MYQAERRGCKDRKCGDGKDRRASEVEYLYHIIIFIIDASMILVKKYTDR